MKTKVFISRFLASDSPFLNGLKKFEVTVDDQMLIDFSPLEFEQPSSDWLFFYSKTGVNFFLKGRGNYSDFKIGTFGPATAAYFERNTSVRPQFIGSGIKEGVAKAFSKLIKDERCLFVIGENSLRSVQKIRNNKQDQEIIVYRNSPMREFSIDYPDIAVFTSPMSVNNYFEKYPNRKHKNIAIGNTTLTALIQYVPNNSVKSDLPTEESLAQCVITYLKNMQ